MWQPVFRGMIKETQSFHLSRRTQGIDPSIYKYPRGRSQRRVVAGFGNSRVLEMDAGGVQAGFFGFFAWGVINPFSSL